MKCKLTLGFPSKINGDVESRQLTLTAGSAEPVVTELSANENSVDILIPLDTDCHFEFVDVFAEGVKARNPLTLDHNEPTPAPEDPEPEVPAMEGSISIDASEIVNDDGTPIS